MSWKSWLSNNATRIELQRVLIAFDTSALLNLYSFPVATTDRYLQILAQLLNRNTANVVTFIPPQVIFEFLTCQAATKRSSVEAYDNVIKKMEAVGAVLDDEPDYVVGSLRSSWRDRAQTAAEPLIADLKRERDAINSRNRKDPILKFLRPLFDKTGRCEPTIDERDWLSSKGPGRYKALVPPGFEDKVKSSGGEENPQSWYVYGPENRILRMHGDLLVWHQLLNAARSLRPPNSVKRIVFVTDDKKPDWFCSEGESQRQHPLLTVEASQAGFGLNVINSDQFLQLTSKALEIQVEASDFEAVRRVLRERQPALEYEKEVHSLTEDYEEGLVAIHLNRPVPVATATLRFDTDFPEKPRLTVIFEGGPTNGVRCFGGVGMAGDFNVHVNSENRRVPLPEGEYILRYKAESVLHQGPNG